MWKAIIEDPEGGRTDLVLKADEYLFGRAPGNPVRLTDRNVSRRHARLRRADGGLVLEDLGSYNGTYVNAAPVVGPATLQHGDHVQIGDYRLVILQDASQPDEPPERARVAAAWFADRPPRLVMLAGPTPGTEFPLTRPRIVIGRTDAADIVVVDEVVSRRHCEVVELEGGRFEIVDLDSANGMLINGQALSRAILDAGDVIVLGEKVAFKYVQAGDLFQPRPSDLRFIPPPKLGHPRVPWIWLLPILIFGAIVLLGGAAACWIEARR